MRSARRHSSRSSTSGCSSRICSSRHARVSGTSMPTRRRSDFTLAGLRRSMPCVVSVPPSRWRSTLRSRSSVIRRSSAASRGRGPMKEAMIRSASSTSTGRPSCSSSAHSSVAADSERAVAAAAGRSARASSRSCCRRWTSSAKTAHTVEVREVCTPLPVDPGRVQVAVGSDRIVVVGWREQIGWRPAGVGRWIEPSVRSPDPAGSGSPAAHEQAVDRLEIRTSCGADAVTDEGGGGVGRPPHPARADVPLDLGDPVERHRRIVEQQRAPGVTDECGADAVGNSQRDGFTAGERHPQPSSCSRSSSIPAAWATSWMTVT